MPNNKNKLGALIVTAAIMGLSLPASADPITAITEVTITTTASIPVDTWMDTVMVIAGAELAAGDTSSHANTSAVAVFPHLFSAGDSIDIGANTVTNSWAAIGAGFGFPYAYQSVYSGIVWDDGPTTTLQTVVFNAGASFGVIGINISNIVADGFTLQATVDLINGANLVLDLTHLHDPGPGPGPGPGPMPVPEPATLPLLVAGLLGLVASMRRKRFM